MRFISLYKIDPKKAAIPPTREHMAAMNELIEETMKSGVLLSTEGLKPSNVRVRRAGRDVTVKDGPFAEAKELIGGYAILNVGSKEEAVAMAKRFLEVAGDGECELHQLYEPSDFAT
jgi:hypothetical protein